MQRPLPRLLLILVTVGTVLATAIAPAGAQTDSATDVAKSDATDIAPTDVRPDVRPDLEILRLRCRGRINADGLPEVRCKWTPPTNDAAHVLVLQRNDGSGDGWEPIWRTRNLERNRYVDTTVEAGQRYRYRVRVFDSEHHLVAASRANGAGVPIPDIDVLKIACDGGYDDVNGKIAKCEWSASDDARYYELWRLVNRGHRELVGTFDHKTFAARDDVPEDAALVRYAVIAFDSDGEIVGRSRPTSVRFPVVSAA